MRAVLLGTAVAAIVAGGTLAATPDRADAAGPCMNRAEYGRIHTGQTPAKVRAIVGAAGKVTTDISDGDGFHTVGREYRVCGSRYGLAWVNWSTLATPGRLGVDGKGFYA